MTLEQAKQYVEDIDRWTKHTMYNRAFDQVCLVGAVRRAVWGDVLFKADVFGEEEGALERNYSELYPEYEKALDLVASTIAEQHPEFLSIFGHGSGHCIAFNDDEARRHADVVAVLEKAAAKEAEHGLD